MNSDGIKRSIRRLKGLEWLGNRAKENDEATNTAVRSLIGIENSIEEMKNDIDKLSTFNEKRSSTTSYQKGYEIGLQAGMEKALKILYKNLDYKEDNST